MSLGKRRRIKKLLKNRSMPLKAGKRRLDDGSGWQDVAHGGRRTAAKYVKSYKHAQTRRDRLQAKREVREGLCES